MIQYLFEYEGRQKRLDEIANPELLSAIRPIRDHIAEALEPESDFNGLKVVFWVDPDVGLKFALRGTQVVVNAAIDRIGRRAEISGRFH